MENSAASGLTSKELHQLVVSHLSGDSNVLKHFVGIVNGVNCCFCSFLRAVQNCSFGSNHGLKLQLTEGHASYLVGSPSGLHLSLPLLVLLLVLL